MEWLENLYNENKKACCILISAVVVVVLIFIGLVWSIDTVEPIEYGLVYNSITKQVGTEVYGGGWYLIGPFKSFLTFPSTQVNMDFSNFPGASSTPLSIKTNGLTCTLAFSYQYQLIKDEVPDLYADRALLYEEKFVTIVKGAISEISANFSIDDYWERRTYVEESMESLVDQRLQSTGFSRCVGFQVIQITPPDTKETALLNTQLATQTGYQKTYQQSASAIRTQINVDTSNADKQITIIQGEASAQATLITNTASATAQNLTISSQQQAYAQVMTLTDQSPSTTLLDYIYYTNLLAQSNLTMMVGVNSASPKVTSLSGSVSGKGYTF